VNAEILPRRARGYAPGEGGPLNASYIDMTIPHAAGALYSTTGDLLRWARGLFGGKLLQAGSLEKMTTPYEDGYALGLGIAEAEGRRVFRHGGGIDGFSTFLAFYPASNPPLRGGACRTRGSDPGAWAAS
jgi:hypothetical protein